MTAGSAEGRAPVLVLGLGNPILADDGVGLELLREFEHLRAPDPRVEYLDGGTQGIALLGELSGRRALLILDAMALGGEPGDVHLLAEIQPGSGGRGLAAHEANAGELLAVAVLSGDLPEKRMMVGVEPEWLKTREGLSESVKKALPAALKTAGEALDSLLDTS